MSSRGRTFAPPPSLFLVGLCFAFGLLCGCRPGTVEVPPDEKSGGEAASLLPVDALVPELQWRQRVTASWDGGERSFGAVLSKADGALQLLGLDPMGRVGFRLELRDGQPIRLEKHPSLQFPFDPRYIVLDVQRIYYPWLPPATAPHQGRRAGRAAGFRVVERYLGGRLVERSFASLGPSEVAAVSARDAVEAHAASEDGPADAAVLAADQVEARARYEYREAFGPVPARATYENLRHGYRLSIETLDVADLGP